MSFYLLLEKEVVSGEKSCPHQLDNVSSHLQSKANKDHGICYTYLSRTPPYVQQIPPFNGIVAKDLRLISVHIS